MCTQNPQMTCITPKIFQDDKFTIIIKHMITLLYLMMIWRLTEIAYAKFLYNTEFVSVNVFV